MDNIQIILYIAFIAIAILSRLLKAKKDTPPPAQDQQNPNSDGPLSFEDLLKEFTGESQKKETPPPYIPKETEEYREYTTQPTSYDDEEAKIVYESAVRDSQKIKTHDETVQLESKRPVFGHFEEYDNDKETVANELYSMLKDEDGIRKAVILNEILNRKY